MNTRYYKSWFRAKKRPVSPLTEDEARSLHNARANYTAVVSTGEQPICFVEITGQSAGVEFLDAFLRPYLSYTFNEVGPEQFFLRRVTYRTFFGDADEVASGSTYLFEQDGKLVIRKETLKPYSLERTEASVDVSLQYVRRPPFGDYGEIIRKEVGPV